MAHLEEVVEELQFISDRLSTQVRTIALGLIALIWGLLVGGGTPILSRSGLLAVGTISVLVLLLDFLQYFFGYLATDAVRQRAEAQRATEARYDYGDWRYRLRSLFFWSKLGVTLLAVAVFLSLVLPTLL